MAYRTIYMSVTTKGVKYKKNLHDPLVTGVLSVVF